MKNKGRQGPALPGKMEAFSSVVTLAWNLKLESKLAKNEKATIDKENSECSRNPGWLGK